MKIHLHSRQGLFTVHSYNEKTITVTTKHLNFTVPVSDFKSIAGGNWNFSVSKQVQDRFLQVVQPEQYALQLQQEQQIMALAIAIKQQDELIHQYNTSHSNEEEIVHDDDLYDHPEYDDNDYQQYEDDYDPEDPTKEEYEQWWREESDKNDELKNKMRSIAHQVYSQNLDFSNFQNHKGIKFIIQTDADESKFRFSWDPYGFVSNGHSDISSIFRADDWYTVNGGWIKIIDNNVILYFKSGDYGVYDDAIAIECAKKVFPTKEIHSFAGRQWDDELGNIFFPLPF
jgi:hypothetical protein